MVKTVYSYNQTYIPTCFKKKRKSKPARLQQTSKYEISPKGAPLIYFGCKITNN